MKFFLPAFTNKIRNWQKTMCFPNKLKYFCLRSFRPNETRMISYLAHRVYRLKTKTESFFFHKSVIIFRPFYCHLSQTGGCGWLRSIALTASGKTLFSSSETLICFYWSYKFDHLAIFSFCSSLLKKTCSQVDIKWKTSAFWMVMIFRKL